MNDSNRRIAAEHGLGVEQLEQEVSELRQALKDKQEQEQVMLQVLMRVEQEQKVTEDARLCVEQEVAAQKYATHVLQEKYEETLFSLAQMEKRAIMAETMLEATLQSSQVIAHSPRTPTLDHSPARTSQEASQEFPTRKIGLLSRPFGLGWRDKNKAKPSAEESSDGTSIINHNGQSLSTSPDNDKSGVKDTNGDHKSVNS